DLPWHLRLLPRRKEPAHGSGPLSRCAVRRSRAREGPRAVRRALDAQGLRRVHAVLAGRLSSALARGAEAQALLRRKLARHRPRRGGPGHGPAVSARARRPLQGGRRDRLRRRAGDLGPQDLGELQRRTRIRRLRHHGIPWPHCL
ncbi:MAG: Cell division protein MraZ, partial [uncultured Solirubrobacteraceae bacterium]